MEFIRVVGAIAIPAVRATVAANSKNRSAFGWAPYGEPGLASRTDAHHRCAETPVNSATSGDEAGTAQFFTIQDALTLNTLI